MEGEHTTHIDELSNMLHQPTHDALLGVKPLNVFPTYCFKTGMNTLGELRGSAHCFAERGGKGGSRFKTGRDAPEATVFVPPGTLVTDIEVTNPP